MESNNDKEEKYRVISLSVFFKRYFQTLSVEVNKQIFNNPVPIFEVQRKNCFLSFINQMSQNNGFDCFTDNSDSDSDYPKYDDYQDIIDNHEENNNEDYNENENEDNLENDDNIYL